MYYKPFCSYQESVGFAPKQLKLYGKNFNGNPGLVKNKSYVLYQKISFARVLLFFIRWSVKRLI